MPVMAQDGSGDDDLSNVKFHVEYIDAKAEKILREGVEAAWAVLKPYAVEHGIDKFPKSNIWGFDDIDTAARVSGISRNTWQRLPGYAIGRNAYIIFRDTSGSLDPYISVIAHEAVHLVQTAIGGGNWGSYCIAEGAANWFSIKARDHVRSFPFEEKINSLRRVNYNSLRTLEFSKLTTRSQFQNSQQKFGGKIYAFCTLAFDMLIETAGGEEAYFNYLSYLRRSNWRTAFNKAFTENLVTFEERFIVYRESGFSDYRFEDEIERDSDRAEFELVVDQCHVNAVWVGTQLLRAMC